MRSAMRAGVNVLKAAAIDNIPVDTGALRRSVKVSTRSSRGVVSAKVSAGGKDAWYARFVEFGTAAHVIKAKPGRFLSIGGAYLTSVNHPGARAKPFMRPALDNKADDALRAFAAKVRSVLSTKHGIDVPAPLLEGDE